MGQDPSDGTAIWPSVSLKVACPSGFQKRKRVGHSSRPYPDLQAPLQPGSSRTSRSAGSCSSATAPIATCARRRLYTYVEEHGEQTSEYRFTIVMCDLPQVAPFVDRLYCERRHGLRLLDSAEDAFRVRNQRIELESDAVDRRYEIFAGSHEDPMRVRQVFEPTFVVWLADHTPADFAFELEAGTLCCNLGGQRKRAAALDELCTAAATVAKRLDDEAAA